jgi:RNA polymerase sigma-70 factor (ECF subfamily)
LEAVIPSSAISAGENAALPSFAQALDNHKAMVYSILWHFLRDRYLAEEVAQDVFLELHRNWKSLKSPAHLVSWLRRVTTHRAIDQVRRQRARPEAALADSAEPTVLERVHDSFLSCYLARMVASLPAQQRMIVILRYQEDMELDEIAQTLHMNVNTVKTQIARALDLLRSKTSHRLRPDEAQGL